MKHATRASTSTPLTFYFIPCSDFAIQFNKNSFGICPGGTLDVQSPLPPGSTSRTSLRLRADGPSAPMNPVNLVQIAIKCNTGISYFAVQLPLHILFAEGGIDQGTWLRMWREDIPASNEWRSPLAGLRFATVADLRSKLALNNIYTVADRLIEGKVSRSDAQFTVRHRSNASLHSIMSTLARDSWTERSFSPRSRSIPALATDFWPSRA